MSKPRRIMSDEKINIVAWIDMSGAQDMKSLEDFHAEFDSKGIEVVDLIATVGGVRKKYKLTEIE